MRSGKGNSMDKLKALFGSDALTFEQLEEKLKDNKEIKLANLASGQYIDKKKFDDKVSELTAANTTIEGLKTTVSKFDGVDIDKLKKDAADWETKYNTDIEAARVDALLTETLIDAKARNPRMLKKMLDMSVIKRDGEKLLGVTEQIDALKKSDAYAFDIEEENPKGGAKVNTGGSHGGNPNIDTFTAAIMKGAGLEMKGE
jgi:hypothetical protein